MGQSNLLSSCHKKQIPPHIPPTSFTQSERNSYQQKHEIGPYLNRTDSDHYKQQEWKIIIQTTNFEDYDLESELIQKYHHCTFPLEKSLKTYYIMSKQHYINLVRQGPPSKLRWAAWKSIILKNEYPYNYNGSSELINKDIKRTLINHPFFQSTNDDYTIGHLQLYHILQGLSNYYPKLGYCQGMNFIAGFLLLVSGGDEYYSYQCLITLLSHPKFMLYFNYDSNFQLLGFLEFITQKQLQIHLPQLYKHLYSQLNYPESFWLTKIILTLFLYNFQLQYCLRFWDYIIVEGIFYLPSLVIKILDQFQSQILVIHEFSEIAQWFQQLDQMTLDVHSLENSNKYRLQKHQIQQYANLYSKQLPLIEQLKSYPKGLCNFLTDALN
ncbi:unnamed protein product [Paramecium pentaurelia]|uniref:Rab-GAP TBC domain-containing protein n=1 Tax=Paramecium pentaurelia TaxID=43138 RepID=A0A8S1X4Y5_9CILI|nr:unnamed protein product [Paramecium pentaurelia]